MVCEYRNKVKLPQYSSIYSEMPFVQWIIDINAFGTVMNTPPDFRESCFMYVRFEVFTVVIMKNAVFWDVMPCGSCKNRRFGGT
jgi:hypothetical protein